MNTFYICRHGQTENNAAQKLSGWIDTPLTPHGVENAETAAKKLADINFTHVYSSDLGRAFTTAYIINRKLNFTDEIHRSHALRENGYGDIANMPTVDAEAQYPELHRNVDFVPPNGESMAQMQERVVSYIQELDARHTDATILLSAHDGVIKSLYCNFSGLDLGAHNMDHTYPNDFVAQFTVQDGKLDSFGEIVIA